MFYALPNKENKTIKILPDYHLRQILPKQDLTLQEVALRLNFEGRLAIPLSKLNVQKVPIEIVLSNQKQNFASLEEASEFIYKGRTFVADKDKAKEGIKKRLTKALTEKNVPIWF